MSWKEGRGGGGNKMDGLEEVDEIGMWKEEEGRKEGGKAGRKEWRKEGSGERSLEEKQ